MKRRWLQGSASGWFSAEATAEKLDISPTTLRNWAKGCPYLGGSPFKPAKIAGPLGRSLYRWSQSQIDDLLRRQSLPPNDDDSVYSIEKTVELTGLRLGILQSKRGRESLGLVAAKRPVHVPYRGEKRAGTNQIQHVTAFTRRSVDAFLQSNPPNVRPRGTMTVAEAMNALRLNRSTVLRWIERGILRATPGHRVTKEGPTGYLIEKTSVDVASKAQRKHGKAINAQTAQWQLDLRKPHGGERATPSTFQSAPSAAGGPSPSSPSESAQDPGTIWAHGSGAYSIGGSEPYSLSNQMDEVLQLFMRDRTALTGKQIRAACGCSNPSKVISDLKKVHGGRFASGIRTPGTQGKDGGFFIRVCQFSG
jgi:hypothetical protein